jgi:hypothetical protein
MLLLILLLALVSSCKTTSTNYTVRINPRLPEDQIRQQILLHTPMGSNASDVLAFILNHLKYVSRPPTYVGSGPVRQHDIIITLGEYGFNPLYRNVTGVRWVFNDDNKLIAVNVDKEIDAP